MEKNGLKQVWIIITANRCDRNQNHVGAQMLGFKDPLSITVGNYSVSESPVFILSRSIIWYMIVQKHLNPKEMLHDRSGDTRTLGSFGHDSKNMWKAAPLPRHMVYASLLERCLMSEIIVFEMDF